MAFVLGGNDVDMGMDPDIVEGQENDVIAALTAAPSFSIVLPFDSLFNAARGIYFNALSYGRDWERPASIELIYPPDFPPETGPRARHGGRDGFAVNAGVRIRGDGAATTRTPNMRSACIFGANTVRAPFPMHSSATRA